ncbi:hypothetical protein E2562_015560, partial [Oryza meyeriana var. granulata]
MHQYHKHIPEPPEGVIIPAKRLHQSLLVIHYHLMMTVLMETEGTVDLSLPAVAADPSAMLAVGAPPRSVRYRWQEMAGAWGRTKQDPNTADQPWCQHWEREPAN